MRIILNFLFLILIICASCHPVKKITRTDTSTEDSLRTHINYLAKDELEGRRTGTAGEKMAMLYIADRFQSLGLLPKGDSGYFQSFEVYDGKEIGKGTWLKINDQSLDPGKDFFPFPFSPIIKMEAVPAISIQEPSMPWFFDLKETIEENKDNPHFDLVSYIIKNVKKAEERGATAIILYNRSPIEDKLFFDKKDRTEKLGIPVIYVMKEAANRFFSDSTGTIDLRFNIEIIEKKRTGHNVIGYMDNGASITVVIGAHYDHLGYGEDGNSRSTGEAAIHNGADDNASGTAALIELARKIKKESNLHQNYLFIAFSGEELGLFGSKYFIEHSSVPLSAVNYMINMDMVGRLNDSTGTLTLGGVGTSPTWNSFRFDSSSTGIKIRIDSSGTGPSDHSSFYRKNIPVLFYFTGLHTDYHKPTDDADKINFRGEALIINHVLNVIKTLDAQPKLVFTKTRETQTTTTTRFSVSLGIMPDYTYSGAGIRADGVSDGKPAQKAGLKAGDIILKLGDYDISSMESYMQALGQFKKGDKTVVKFKRGTDLIEATVEF